MADMRARGTSGVTDAADADEDLSSRAPDDHELTELAALRARVIAEATRRRMMWTSPRSAGVFDETVSNGSAAVEAETVAPLAAPAPVRAPPEPVVTPPAPSDTTTSSDEGPTRGASEEQAGWSSSRWLAFGIRLIARLVPLVAGFVAVRVVGGWLFRPPGWLGFALWLLQAVVIGTAVSMLVDRQARRMLPLAALFNMSLVFPDRAPSRFGVALRTGTLRQMRRRLDEVREHGLGDDETEAAERAIEMVAVLGAHDRLTRGHTERVRAYADMIAEELGIVGEDRQKLAWGVMLHDVGKLTVPGDILNKDTRPTAEEWEVLKRHPAAGAEMLEPLADWLGEWVLAAGEHHERWDGKGYPKGLAGTEISLAGRIAAVADAYDVITSKRSYKTPMSHEAARRELVACAGKQFDPEVVRAMLNVSVGSKWSLGPLSWLGDSSAWHAASSAATTPVAATVAAAASAASALTGGAPDPAPVVPDDPIAVVEEWQPDVLTTTAPGTAPAAESSDGDVAVIEGGEAVGTGDEGEAPLVRVTVPSTEVVASTVPDSIAPTTAPAGVVAAPGTAASSTTLAPSNPAAPSPVATTTTQPAAAPPPQTTLAPTTVVTTTVAPSPVVEGVEFANHVYVLGASGQTWQQAVAQAEAMGGQIVDVQSAAENKFLLEQFGGDAPVWLGCSDTDVEGEFEWSSGIAFGYENWLPVDVLADPGRAGSAASRDQCLMADANGRWADASATSPQWLVDGAWVDATPRTVTVIELPK